MADVQTDNNIFNVGDEVYIEGTRPVVKGFITSIDEAKNTVFIDGDKIFTRDDKLKHVKNTKAGGGSDSAGTVPVPVPVPVTVPGAGAGAVPVAIPGAGAGAVPGGRIVDDDDDIVVDKNAVLLKKAEDIKSILEENKNYSLEPKIDQNTVTLVAITKLGNDIKYDTIAIENIENVDDYITGEHTYNQPAKPKSVFSMFSKSTGGNKHFKTIRNKNRNYRKTEKAGKKNVSKRKRVLLNKHRKTHHK